MVVEFAFGGPGRARRRRRPRRPRSPLPVLRTPRCPDPAAERPGAGLLLRRAPQTRHGSAGAADRRRAAICRWLYVLGEAGVGWGARTRRSMSASRRTWTSLGRSPRGRSGTRELSSRAGLLGTGASGRRAGVDRTGLGRDLGGCSRLACAADPGAGILDPRGAARGSGRVSTGRLRPAQLRRAG